MKMPKAEEKPPVMKQGKAPDFALDALNLVVNKPSYISDAIGKKDSKSLADSETQTDASEMASEKSSIPPEIAAEILKSLKFISDKQKEIEKKRKMVDEKQKKLDEYCEQIELWEMQFQEFLDFYKKNAGHSKI